MSPRNLFAIALLPLGLACGKSNESRPDTAAVITNIGPARGNQPATPAPPAFALTSSVFEQNASMPIKYTCEGDNISPPLAWAGTPASAKSLALIVEDPDAPDPAKPTRVVTHWVAYDIPAATTRLNENASKAGMPTGSAQGANERGARAYMGPCPPIGRHRYFFKLFALDTTLDGLTKPKKADVEKAIKGHIVDSAQLIATYQKMK